MILNNISQTRDHFDGSVHDSGNSIANALDLTGVLH